LLLFAVALFKVPGLVVGTTLWFLILALQRSYNTPYLWPFLPFNLKAIWEVIVRRSTLTMKHRLSLTKTLDGTRQPQ
jgi:stage V sporulation protein AF